MRKLYIVGLVAVAALVIGLPRSKSLICERGIAIADEVIISTFYPAPFGQYREFSTTGKTTLATDEWGIEGANARVGIGTTDPQAKLHVGGEEGVDGIMFPDGTLQTTAAIPTIVGGRHFGTGTNWVSYDVSDADLIFLTFHVADRGGCGNYWLERKQDGWYISGYAVGGDYNQFTKLGTSTADFRLAWEYGKYDVQMQIIDIDTFSFWTWSGATSEVNITKFGR